MTCHTCLTHIGLDAHYIDGARLCRECFVVRCEEKLRSFEIRAQAERVLSAEELREIDALTIQRFMELNRTIQ
jgi:hypothetical protein